MSDFVSFSSELTNPLINIDNTSLSQGFQRYAAFGMMLFNAGLFDAAATVLKIVFDSTPLELKTTPPAYVTLCRRSLAFLTESTRAGRLVVNATLPVLDPAQFEHEELQQRREWALHLRRGDGSPNRTTWRSRVDPLDTLRCALQYTSPTINDTFPRAEEEREGLEALQRFLDQIKIQSSAGKNRLGSHSLRALSCAIEMAARCNRNDAAFELATHAAEIMGRSHIETSFDCSFGACRTFLPLFIAAATNPSSPYANHIVDIRKSLSGARHADLPLSLFESYEAEWLRIGLGELVTKAHSAPLGKMLLSELLDELGRTSKATPSMKTSSSDMDADVNFYSVFERRQPARYGEIHATGKRLNWVIPDDFKTFYRLSDGWECSVIDRPSFGRVSTLTIEHLNVPLAIASSSGEIQNKGSKGSKKVKNAYDPGATVTDCIRLDSHSAPASSTSPSSSKELYIIRDVDLILLDDSQPNKKVKLNDGTTRSKKPYAEGQYRIALIHFDPSREVKQVEYFDDVRTYIEMLVERCDAVLGVTRDKVKPPRKWKTPVMKEKEPLPVCWYGTECRTQHHNPMHATKYDHSGPNIRKV